MSPAPSRALPAAGHLIPFHPSCPCPCSFFGELTFFTAACMGVGINRPYTWEPPLLDYLVGHIVSQQRSDVSSHCLSDIMSRSCLSNSSSPPGRVQRAPVTDRLIAWTIHYTADNSSRRVLEALRTSVLMAQTHAIREKVALLVLHTKKSQGGIPVTCELLHASVPCQRIELTATKECNLGPPRLAPATLYIGTMVTVAGDDGLQELNSHIISRTTTRVRPDLVRGGAAVANNFRYVLDKLLLPQGVRQALYLDCDTCIQARTNISAFFAASDSAAIVAAHRRIILDKRYLHGGMQWPEYNFNKTDMALMERRWGFHSPREQGFNAGVLMINTRPFCRENIFGIMLEVGRFHAYVEPLWRLSGNQAIAEVASARYIGIVNGSWNCAKDPLNSRDCHIVHGNVEAIQRWCGGLPKVSSGWVVGVGSLGRGSGGGGNDEVSSEWVAGVGSLGGGSGTGGGGGNNTTTAVFGAFGFITTTTMILTTMIFLAIMRSLATTLKL